VFSDFKNSVSLHNLLSDGYWVSFPGVKRPRRDVDHPPSSSSEAKEGSIALPVPFMSCYRVNFTFASQHK
jgi:hypothetical protein